MGEESIFTIFRSILVFLIFANIIMGLMEVGTTRFNVITSFPMDIPGPGVIHQGESTGTKILYQSGSFILGTLQIMIEGGMLLAIYRRVRYRIKPKLVDLFIFFNDNFLRNFFFVLVLSIIRAVAYMLFVIPGMIFDLAMYLWPFVLMEYQEGIRKGTVRNPVNLLKDTNGRTSGYKGEIFVSQLKWTLLVIIPLTVIAVIGYFGFSNLTFNAESFYTVITGSVLAVLITILLLVFFVPMMYCYHIELMQELPSERLEPPAEKRAGPHTDRFEPRREAYRQNPFDTTAYPPQNDPSDYHRDEGYDIRDQHPGRGDTKRVPKQDGEDHLN